MKKTNALRILDQHGVPYEVIEYQYDAEDLSVQMIAQMNNLLVKQVYKTLVLKGDKTGVVVALVPGDQKLVFKAAAQLSANKKITTVAVKDLQGLTGYVRGGCSPLGMKKQFPVIADEAIEQLDEVLINAGRRGVLMKLAVSDLLKVTQALRGSIAEPMV